MLHCKKSITTPNFEAAEMGCGTSRGHGMSPTNKYMLDPT